MAENLYFVGGGNMPTAIIAAIRQKEAAGTYQVGSIYVEEISAQRAEFLKETYGVTPATPADAPADVDIAVVAVRPQDDVAGVVASLGQRFDPARTTIVSIVAGYTIAKIEASLPAGFKVARIIPNTLTTVDYGYTGVALNENAHEEDVHDFLATFGKPLYVEERLIDIITGFYGPNIVYHFIDALVDAGVLAGLPRDIARKITLDNLIGGTEFLIQKNALPQQLLNINNSPGGVGITQAYTLNKTGFAASVQASVLAAVQRTTQMGTEAK